MKKIILTIALFASMLSFAQGKTEEVKQMPFSGDKRLFTISYTGGNSLIWAPPVKLNNGGIGNAGVSFEMQFRQQKDMSGFLDLNYAYASVSADGVVHNSHSGYGVEIGFLGYNGVKMNSNLGGYFGLSLSYANCKFTDANYSGVYNFIGFNIPFGWKGFLYGGKHFLVDLALVPLYKIEFTPSGNVDNKPFNNFEYRANVKLGWRF